jgi:hypothetical protein
MASNFFEWVNSPGFGERSNRRLLIRACLRSAGPRTSLPWRCFQIPLGSQAYPALVEPPLKVQTNPGQHGAPSHGWPCGAHWPATPMPLSETICGLSAALSANESVPFKLPVLPGVKVTMIVQLAPDARVELQLFV